MIFAEELIKSILKKKINFFTGVPDSILKPLSEILQKKNKKNHIIATNEGSAIALGIGYGALQIYATSIIFLILI